MLPRPPLVPMPGRLIVQEKKAVTKVAAKLFFFLAWQGMGVRYENMKNKRGARFLGARVLSPMLIRDRLTAGKPSISFEFFPPKSDEAAAQLERTIAELSVLEPAFVSVTYGAGGSTREKTLEIVSRIREQAGIEAMAHLTCVGATREEIGRVVGRLTDAGVTNILALRGDPPKGETKFRPVENGFVYANELVSFIRDRHGAGLSVGAAAYPETHIECADAATDLANL